MPNVYRTSDEIVASRLEDGKQTKLQLNEMMLFACGAFSNVYKGVARTESNHHTDVVVKKTWPRQRRSPIEVRILGKLNRLKHKNIVRLLYSYQKEYEGKICLALIFEYIPLNLHQYLKMNNRRIDIVEIKMIAWQLFRGQWHLQRMDICHRDIKPQNLLFNADSGLLKISDFGSSAFEPRRASQPSYHVTRYYRPPELLLGSKQYGYEIDVWSSGCVFGEMLRGSVLLPGRNATNQLELIFEALDRPSADDVKSMNVLESKFFEVWHDYEPASRSLSATTPTMHNFEFLTKATSPPQSTKERRVAVFNNMISPTEMKEAVEILKSILIYNPYKRLHGTELLLSPFFQDLFLSTTTRMNGKKIGCLSIQDLNVVKIGDKTITGTDTTDEN